jgi:DNA-binding MarR family transcriptional regulator
MRYSSPRADRGTASRERAGTRRRLRFDPVPELRRTLALGRGSGRVRTLLGLADGPLSVARLAEASGADAPYTTLIVNELEALGLVSRTSDERDRRRKLVALTASGREAVRTAQSIIVRPPTALRGLPREDLAELRRILERLGSAAERAETAESAQQTGNSES